MPFNSNTYYINKYRRECVEAVAQGRAAKARIAAGLAGPYDLKPEWFAARARHALTMWRIERRIRALNRRT